MATLNIGDKVRFLNDVGGGIIAGFQRGGIVLVEDEDGFQIPVKETEVVLVSAAEKKLTQTQDTEREEEPVAPAYRIKTILAHKGDSGIASANQDKGHESNVAPVSNRQDSNDTCSLEERVEKLEKTVKRLMLRIEQLENAKSLREKIESAGLKVRESKSKAKKDNIIEVDLHAAEILDTTTGMQAADIKEYQLDVFRKTMNEHLKEKGRRIVFIHGNGDGVLRRAILEELRFKYKQCEHQDASFQQYGFGATMVIIH